MKSDNLAIKDRNAGLNEDGTFTAFFEYKTACAARAKRVDTRDGWEFLIRIYPPGPSVLARPPTLPKVSIVK